MSEEFELKNRIRDYFRTLNLPPAPEDEWLAFAISCMKDELDPVMEMIQREQEQKMERERNLELYLLYRQLRARGKLGFQLTINESDDS